MDYVHYRSCKETWAASSNTRSRRQLVESRPGKDRQMWPTIIFVAIVLAAVALIVGVNRWSRNRAEVDDYYERDYRAPPAGPRGGIGGGR